MSLRLFRSTSLLLVAGLALTACQLRAPRLSDGEQARDPRVSGQVLARSYEDSFKIDGQDVIVSVEYAWDYGRAVAIERITAADGRLISLSEQPDLTLNLTEPEKEYAFEIAAAHPRLREQMAAASFVYGGFSYREADDPACFTGSRCVHVVASGGKDGLRKLVHAIVDVQRGVVVHPDYTSSESHPLTREELQARSAKP